MSEHVATYVECDGDRCAKAGWDRARLRMYGTTIPEIVVAARHAGWSVSVPFQGSPTHLCPYDRDDAKCGIGPLTDLHIGPWVEVAPWQDVKECEACGTEISK